MSASQPLTFLFTDIEGSTPLWESARAEMEVAVARHEEILASAIAANGGRIVKTMGDGLYATFTDPPSAALAAAVAMERLIAEPWDPQAPIRVRMGIHLGDAEERGGDYYGPTLNRAARIMGAAHGSQIVVSADAAAAIGEQLSHGLGLRSLGEVRLRGLSAPERVSQLVADSLPVHFPPLPGSEIPGNLPAAPTSFIGRDGDVAAVEALLDQHRLATLTGFGGSGKTRLAIEVAAHTMADYPAGVWFIDLADVRSPSLVAQAFASTLEVAEEAGTDLVDSIGRHLGEGPTLLVVDNCEQVVAGAAAVVEGLLQRTAAVRLLATSRTPLAVAGEHIHAVEPLEVSANGAAVQLFLERARAATTGFAPGERQLVAIERIVRQLDGIPLAIELAAVRTRMMEPTEIAERLDDRFRLLTGGGRGAEPRQRTLRALVDWSYDLLTEQQKRLFNRLAGFAGPFTVAAADAVCGDDGVDSFELLAALVDQSMVRRRPSDDEARFGMLETLRSFAAERLDDTGDTAEVLRRHAEYFAERCEDADELLRGPDQSRWHRRLSAEEADLLQALDWLAENAPDLGLEMAAQLGRFWYRRGMVSVGVDSSRRALATASPLPSEARARARAWTGFFTNLQGDRISAREDVEAALAIAEEVGSGQVKAQALNLLGAFADNEGDVPAAVRLWQAAVDELDAVRSEWVTGPLYNLGYGLVDLGDVDGARPTVARLQAIGAARDDEWTATIGDLLGAYVDFASGALDEADDAAQSVLVRFKDQGAVFHAGEACVLRASIAELRGDVPTAQAELQAAQDALAETGAFEGAEAQILISRIAWRAGDRAESVAALARAMRANEADPNASSEAKLVHEAARHASGRREHELAVELSAASLAGFRRAGVRPAAYLLTEAEEISHDAGAGLSSDQVTELEVRGRAAAGGDIAGLISAAIGGS